MRALLLLFLVSGFPALIYQIIWQRALFAVFGSNIESVTLVVGAFMLGLGLGSLSGGRLSASARVNSLLVFGLFECAIGAFGIVSLDVIAAVGVATLGVGPIGTFLATFMTVLLPTLMMGATLPLLVMHLVHRNGKVGHSVSLLYSANTWGSAIACFVGAFIVFGALGMQGSVWLAAALNLCIGVVAIAVALREPEAAPQTAQHIVTDGRDARRANTGHSAFGMPAAILLVGITGFVSLSYEILWTRVFFLDMAGRAFAFPIVLGLFLAGIAFGASFVRNKIDFFQALVARWALLPFAALFLLANVISFFVVPAVISFGPAGRGLGALLIVLSSAAFGAILPLASNVAVRSGRMAGYHVSQLYIASIVGSTTGTIATGLVLLDHLPLSSVAVVLFATSLLACCILLFFQPVRALRIAGPAGAGAFVIPALLLGAPHLHDGLYEKLQFHGKAPDGFRFANVAETRSGVVAITPDNVVFGTGVYDGRAEVDLVKDRNGLFRATAVSAVHRAPKEVLVIGLSAAAWTQVLVNLSGVDRVTAIEINPGYLSLIARYPALASVLDNPKVDIVIDDGRRWLQRHPDRKFDVIVANTTFHWRAGASNLLSVEFLELVRSRLSPEGVYYFNTTSSDAVQKTAASVFRHAARFEHMMLVSEAPIEFDKQRWLRELETLRVDGAPLLDFQQAEHRSRAEMIVDLADRVGALNPRDELEFAVEFRDSILNRTAALTAITDDNMGGEWPKLLFPGAQAEPRP